MINVCADINLTIVKRFGSLRTSHKLPCAKSASWFTQMRKYAQSKFRRQFVWDFVLELCARTRRMRKRKRQVWFSRCSGWMMDHIRINVTTYIKFVLYDNYFGMTQPAFFFVPTISIMGLKIRRPQEKRVVCIIRTIWYLQHQRKWLFRLFPSISVLIDIYPMPDRGGGESGAYVLRAHEREREMASAAPIRYF